MNRTAARRASQIRIAVANLDRLANYLQANAKRHGLSPRFAKAVALRMDRVSDLLEEVNNDFVDEDWSDDVDYLTSPEQGSLSQEYQEDEPYMETFDAPSGLHEGDADEESYMDWFNNNDFEEVQEHVQEDRAQYGYPNRTSSRRRRLSANVSDWRHRWAEEGEDDHEAEEMTEEEHKEAMRWARAAHARQRQALQARGRRR